MNHLLRPRIWPSFWASSGIGSCDLPFRHASEPIPRYRGRGARLLAHLRGLTTAIHETFGLEVKVFLACIIHESSGFVNKHPQQSENFGLRVSTGCFRTRSRLALSGGLKGRSRSPRGGLFMEPAGVNE